MRTAKTDISGLIPIMKPLGMTSKDVSRALIRKYGKIKLGHVGTLDPEADGVLPVLIGRGTKLQDYLLCMDKAYRFEMELGTATDTLDATGKIVATCPWQHVTKEKIESTINLFVGELNQVPPLYSAVKYKGKELYKYAHDGKAAKDIPLHDLQRNVRVYSLAIDYVNLPRIGLTVVCSKGTYVRTLAGDLATALDSIGHVTRLTRTYSAGFTMDACTTLEHATAEMTTLESIAIPLDKLSIGLPTWTPDDMLTLQRLVNGQHVTMDLAQFPIVVSHRPYDVLAKSSQGISVGIVNVMPLEGGKIKLHMKRGL